MTQDGTIPELAPRAPFRLGLLPCVLLIAATGTAAYCTGFQAPFNLDDILHIQYDSNMHRLRFPQFCDRGTAIFTFQLNYVLHGLSVVGYHVGNLLFHLLGCLALYGLVRRSMALPVLSRYANVAKPLALVSALVWAVHPLASSAVTYISQRSEVMMGLFFLLMLYALLRSDVDGKDSLRKRYIWQGLCVLSFFLGVCSKTVIFVAPAVLMAYDRLFLTRSWREMMQARWPLYLLIWALSIGFYLHWQVAPPAPVGYTDKGTFTATTITRWNYLCTQAGVVLLYLRLSFWPAPLCFDYRWPVEMEAWTASVLVPGTVILGLLAATIWGFRRHPGAAFLGFSFFVILAPTSSVFPMTDPAFEHRAYLPLAFSIVFQVVLAYRLLSWVMTRWRLSPAGVTQGLVSLAVLWLGVFAAMAQQRNALHADLVALWKNVARLQPHNVKAHYNEGAVLSQRPTLTDAQKNAESMAAFQRAVALDPSYVVAIRAIGEIHLRNGDLQNARFAFQDVLRYRASGGGRPDLIQAQLQANLGLATVYLRENKPDVAEQHLRFVLSQKQYQGRFEFWALLGQAMALQDKYEGGLQAYEQSLLRNPNLLDAYFRMAQLWHKLATKDPEKVDEEKMKLVYKHLFHVLGKEDTHVPSLLMLSKLTLLQGDVLKAAQMAQKAVQAAPGNAEAKAMMNFFGPAVEDYMKRAIALEQAKRGSEAIETYQQALKIHPWHPEVLKRLGTLYADMGDLDRAEFFLERAIAVFPNFPKAYDHLGVVHLRKAAVHAARKEINKYRHEMGVAISKFERALSIDPKYLNARRNLAEVLHNDALNQLMPYQGKSNVPVSVAQRAATQLQKAYGQYKSLLLAVPKDEAAKKKQEDVLRLLKMLGFNLKTSE